MVYQVSSNSKNVQENEQILPTFQNDKNILNRESHTSQNKMKIEKMFPSDIA
jgi:hypothetical protein